MPTARQPIGHDALKLQSRVQGSISRRSRHKRRCKGMISSDHGSVVSRLSSTSVTESMSFFGEDSKSSFPVVACEEILHQADPLELTLDIPVRYYGDYRTIQQHEFFIECMIDCEGSALVHFFDENHPTSIELDSMLGKLATKYTACKFLRIHRLNSQLVASKLKIKSFPTILAIRNKNILGLLSDFDGYLTQEDLEKQIFRSLPLMSRP